MMTMRKRLRRRNAIRELLQKLVTVPFCEDAPRASGETLSVSHPVLVNGSRAGGPRRARG